MVMSCSFFVLFSSHLNHFFQDLLLSPSDGSESELSETEQLQIMLELQCKKRKKWKKRLKRDHKVRTYNVCVCLFVVLHTVHQSWLHGVIMKIVSDIYFLLQQCSSLRTNTSALVCCFVPRIPTLSTSKG